LLSPLEISALLVLTCWPEVLAAVARQEAKLSLLWRELEGGATIASTGVCYGLSGVGADGSGAAADTCRPRIFSQKEIFQLKREKAVRRLVAARLMSAFGGKADIDRP
jgi:hypothetical protein